MMDQQIPDTPESMQFEDDYDLLEPTDIDKAHREEDETRHGLATTPLLPPVMVPEPANSSTVVQSPLQSPAVANEIEPPAGSNSPIEIPNVSSIPSPPLSTKPSTSSFRRRPTSNLIPSSEIPPMLITEPSSSSWDRAWAEKLGHANFNIHPEPYEPDVLVPGSRAEFRANWDQARTNYTKHLVRTGEHYGATSTTYHLTEAKWAEVDVQWQRVERSLSFGAHLLWKYYHSWSTQRQPIQRTSP